MNGESVCVLWWEHRVKKIEQSGRENYMHILCVQPLTAYTVLMCASLLLPILQYTALLLKEAVYLAVGVGAFELYEVRRCVLV